MNAIEKAISQLVAKGESIKTAELNWRHRQLTGATEDTMTVTDELTGHIVDRLFQLPIWRLRRAAETEDGCNLAVAVSELFDLP